MFDQVGSNGPEYMITNGSYQASIASVGATLRSLTHGKRDLIVPFSEDEIRPLYRGATIAPWPNRIDSGRYGFNGQNYALPINETDRNNAIHGLVQWVRWDLVAHTSRHVTLTHQLVPQPGYPVSTAATNYLSGGSQRADRLYVSNQYRSDSSALRLLPTSILSSWCRTNRRLAPDYRSRHPN